MNKFYKIYLKFREGMRGVPKVSLAVLLILIGAAIFADFLALHHPEMGDPSDRLLPPFWQEGGSMKYPLGTDLMGRDVYTRLIFGARISMVVAFSSVFLAAFVGTLMGAVSGFFGGWVDQVVMRFTDAWLSIPGVMFAILLVVVFEPGVSNIVIILTIIFWTRYARIARGETLSLRSRDFVNLAIIAGCSRTSIIIRHILPNLMNSMITIASLAIGIVIVAEASLSFLGVGVPPPKPAWGLMLAEGRGGLFTGQWWLIVFPGLAIGLLVMSFNFLGDWLRRRLDPHQQNLL